MNRPIQHIALVDIARKSYGYLYRGFRITRTNARPLNTLRYPAVKFYVPRFGATFPRLKDAVMAIDRYFAALETEPTQPNFEL